MTTVFVLLAIVLAIASYAVGRPTKRRLPGLPFALVAALFVIFGLAVWKAKPDLLGSVTNGYLIGAAVAVLACFLTVSAGSRLSACAAALGLALAGDAVLQFLPLEQAPSARIAFIVGCALSAFLLDLSEGSMAYLSALAATAMIVADRLGANSFPPGPVTPGIAFGLIASALAAVSSLVSRSRSGGLRILGAIVLTVVFAALEWAVARQYSGSAASWHNPWADLKGDGQPVWQALLVGVVGGIAGNWLLPDAEKPDSGKLGLAIILWCALATVAFGFVKSYGVALAFLSASAVMFILGNPRAIAALSPLAVLALYRVFRDSHPDAYTAIDIGQHYAVIGLVVGISATVMPLEWLRSHPSPEGKKSLLGILVWAIILLVLPTLVGIVLGDKGLIGLLIGGGIAVLLTRLSDRATFGVSALAIALSGTIVLTYGWRSDLMDLTRDEKIHALVYPALGLIVAAIVLGLLHGKSRTEAVHEAA